MLLFQLTNYEGLARIGDEVHVFLRPLSADADYSATSARKSRRRATSSRKISEKGKGVKRDDPPTEAEGDPKRQQVETLEEEQAPESQVSGRKCPHEDCEEEFADLVE